MKAIEIRNKYLNFFKNVSIPSSISSAASQLGHFSDCNFIKILLPCKRINTNIITIIHLTVHKRFSKSFILLNRDVSRFTPTFFIFYLFSI